MGGGPSRWEAGPTGAWSSPRAVRLEPKFCVFFPRPKLFFLVHFPRFFEELRWFFPRFHHLKCLHNSIHRLHAKCAVRCRMCGDSLALAAAREATKKLQVFFAWSGRAIDESSSNIQAREFVARSLVLYVAKRSTKRRNSVGPLNNRSSTTLGGSVALITSIRRTWRSKDTMKTRERSFKCRWNPPCHAQKRWAQRNLLRGT